MIAAHHVTPAEILEIVGGVIVIGCLIAAAFAARAANWIAVALLLVVALVAGYLLL